MKVPFLTLLAIVLAAAPQDLSAQRVGQSVVVLFEPGAIESATHLSGHAAIADAFRRAPAVRAVVGSHPVVLMRPAVPSWDAFVRRYPSAPIQQRRRGELMDPNALTDLSLLYEMVMEGSESAARAFANELENQPGVVYAGLNAPLEDLGVYEAKPGDAVALLTPNDPTGNWGFNNTGAQQYDVNAFEAWELQTGISNVIISIIDTGGETTDPDFDSSGKIAGGYDAGDGDSDFQPDPGGSNPGHGMGVAGIAAAETNDGTGMYGMCGGNGTTSGCRILMVKATTFDDVSTEIGLWIKGLNRVADAITWSMANGATVLNNSYCSDGSWYTQRNGLHDAIRNAYLVGGVVAAATGNTEQNSDGDWKCEQDEATDPVVPASWSDIVLGVGATDPDGDRVSRAQNHPWESGMAGVSLVAPGISYQSADLGAGMQSFGGTSGATPFVSGSAALLVSEAYERGMSFTARDVYEILKATATPPRNVPSGYNFGTGWGIVNAYGALAALQPPNVFRAGDVASPGAVCHEFRDQETWTFMGSSVVGFARRCEIRQDVTFPKAFTSTPIAWGRSHASAGMTPSDPNSEIGWTGIVEGTLTRFGMTLRTYTYEVWSTTGNYLGWHPAPPSQIRLAWGALGREPAFVVSANAPSYVTVKATYPLGGSANYPASGWRWDSKNSQQTTYSFWANGQNSSFIAYAGDYTYNWRLYASRQSSSETDYGYADTHVCIQKYGGDCEGGEPPVAASSQRAPISVLDHFGSGLWVGWQSGDEREGRQLYSLGEGTREAIDWSIGDDGVRQGAVGPLRISIEAVGPIVGDSARYHVRVIPQIALDRLIVGLAADPDLGGTASDDFLWFDGSAAWVSDPSGTGIEYRLTGGDRTIVRQYSLVQRGLHADPRGRIADEAHAESSRIGNAADDIRFALLTAIRELSAGVEHGFTLTVRTGSPPVDAPDDGVALVPGNDALPQEFDFRQRFGTGHSSAGPVAVSASAFSGWRMPQGDARRMIAQNGITGLAFAVPGESPQQVRITIYDANGHLVQTLLRERQAPGYYTLEWNGLDDRGARAAPGVYVAVMTSGAFQKRTNLVLVR